MLYERNYEAAGWRSQQVLQLREISLCYSFKVRGEPKSYSERYRGAYWMFTWRMWVLLGLGLGLSRMLDPLCWHLLRPQLLIAFLLQGWIFLIVFLTIRSTRSNKESVLSIDCFSSSQGHSSEMKEFVNPFKQMEVTCF